jgi:hypothetical protein
MTTFRHFDLAVGLINIISVICDFFKGYRFYEKKLYPETEEAGKSLDILAKSHK